MANILYPGSPQAMDFGEAGAHGVWLLDTDEPELIPVQWQVSTVRYEDSLRLDLSETDQIDDVERELLALSRSQIDGLAKEERNDLRCVVHRCTLGGEFGQPEAITGLSGKLPEFVTPACDGIHICYQGGVRDLTTLPLDIGALEQRGGALGELALRYRLLGSNEWREAGWFAEIHSQVLAAYRACPLEGDGEQGERISGQGSGELPGEEQTKDWLLAQTKRLLVAARAGTS
jgi:hypothetical protein